MYRKMKKLLLVCTIFLLSAGCGSNSGYYVEQAGTDRQADNGLEGDGQSSVGSQNAGDSASSQNAGQGADSSADQQNTASGDRPTIYVQVCGAVKYPGVYALAEGSRVFEAVALAGGLTEEADGSAFNQAETVTDGQMIYVYAIGEKAREEQNAREMEEADGRVNLNTATREQLMTLPGIGASKAESILSFRETHGAFEKIEDIMKTEGIKEGVFSKIKDHIKVN